MKKVMISMASVLFLLSCMSSSSEALMIDTNNIQAAGVMQAKTQNQTSLSGRWNLIPALPSDTATGRLPFLHFDTQSGKVSGNTGCNNFSGTYVAEQDSIAFSKNLVTTKMACAGYDENAFLTNLLRVNNYSINGDTLELEIDAAPVSYWLKEK